MCPVVPPWTQFLCPSFRPWLNKRYSPRYPWTRSVAASILDGIRDTAPTNKICCVQVRNTQFEMLTRMRTFSLGPLRSNVWPVLESLFEKGTFWKVFFPIQCAVGPLLTAIPIWIPNRNRNRFCTRHTQCATFSTVTKCHHFEFVTTVARSGFF